eukprot:TRINITY_DN2865_c0_g1_i1.p1 TRINITY_DN2865_c0_g1~~TRINITY_DN2865_c0_g1_i1.p1  ORF type:complete len:556 (+),score=123.98 TRINITY_DN2865_c0_g1_i1:1329-2996(+)
MACRVSGTVIKARNLVSRGRPSCDPQLIIGPADETGDFAGKKKTRLKSKIAKSFNPDFDFNFELELPLGQFHFKIEVIDNTTSEFLGQVGFLHLEKLPPTSDDWFPLCPQVGTDETVGGEIQVSYKFDTDHPIPPLRFEVVNVLCLWIDNNSLDSEGLFRISGSDKDVRSLFSQFFDYSKVPVIETIDPHVVTGALKLYLREIEPALIPNQLYQTFIKAFENAENVTETIEKTKAVFNLLPEDHRFVLIRLMATLRRVADKANENLMNPSNLGIVFGPTITRDASGSFDLNSATREKTAVEFVIENFHKIFESGTEEKVISEAEALRAAEEKKKVKSFYVFFPGGKKTIQYDPDRQLRPVLEKICTTSDLNLQDFMIVGENSLEINPDTKIGDLVGTSVTLRENKKGRKTQITRESSSESSDIRMTPKRKKKFPGESSETESTSQNDSPNKTSDSIIIPTSERKVKQSRAMKRSSMVITEDEHKLVHLQTTVRNLDLWTQGQKTKFNQLVDRVQVLESENVSIKDKISEALKVLEAAQKERELLQKRIEILEKTS